MEVNAPDSSILPEPFNVGRDYTEAKQSFFELAKSRITYRSQEEHYAFEKAIYGDAWQRSSAVYVLGIGTSGEHQDPEHYVTALEISINKDFFGKDNADLIPYAVEHEVYEAWVWSKRGFKPQSADTIHLLARQRQFEMAMADGKAEKLLGFYKSVNPEFTSELQYAYDKAKSRATKK